MPAVGNRQQNYPEISSAAIVNGDLIVEYLVPSIEPNSISPLTIEFFRGDGNGQGKTFLGSDLYPLPPITFVVNLGSAAGLGVSAGDELVATATDSEIGTNLAVSDGNTSEFSLPVSVVDVPTPTPTPTSTSPPTLTNTATSTPTSTPSATPTQTHTPKLTSTPTNTPSSSPTEVATSTPTDPPTPTSTPTASNTPMPSGTSTQTPAIPGCLSIATGFNVFVSEDANLSSSDVEGKLAIGGNARLLNYSVGRKVVGLMDVLVVGEDLDL